MNKTVKMIAIGLLIFMNIFAQEKSARDIDWLSIGTGIGEQKRLSSILSYTFVSENIYQLAINYNQEFSLFGKTDPDLLVATSFSFGKKIDWSFLFGGVFIGPSIVFVKKTKENIIYTVGANFSSQILFFPESVLAFGFDVFGNINFYEPFCGVRMVLYFKSIK